MKLREHRGLTLWSKPRPWGLSVLLFATCSALLTGCPEAVVPADQLADAGDSSNDMAQVDSTTTDSGGTNNIDTSQADSANVSDSADVPPPVGVIVISEFQPTPCSASDELGEWIELVNVGDAAVDLDGWTLTDAVDQTHIIDIMGDDAGLVVNPNGYVVLGRSGDTETNGGILVDYVYSDIDLDDTRDILILIDADGLEADRIEYDETYPVGECGSIQLHTDFVNPDDNDVDLNWCYSVAPEGTDDDGRDPGSPGAANDECDVCGDMTVGVRELCDEGELNSDTVPDACRTNCQPAGCGDGITDMNEGCDDGPQGSEGCSALCAEIIAVGTELACRFQRPTVARADPNDMVTFYGRVYADLITDLTTGTDPSELLSGELGIGPDGTDPSTEAAWTWLAAAPIEGWDDELDPDWDEYEATLSAPADGNYDVAFRFARTGGDWLYCDRWISDGSDGSEDGYQSANAGALISGTYYDADAAVIASDALVEPTSIDSIDDAVEPRDVFDFQLVDGGGLDEQPLIVTQIVIHNTGDADADDHGWVLSYGDQTSSPVISGEIGMQVLTFGGLSIEIDQAGSELFTLALTLTESPDNTPDNSAFVLSVAGADISVGSGTTFADDDTGTNNAGGLAYTVVATRLGFIVPPSEDETAGVGFDVGVGFVDDHGNIDRDVTGDVVTIASRTPEGEVLQGSSQTTSSGMANFIEANQVRLGVPLGDGITLTFQDDAEGTLDFSDALLWITTDPFDLNKAADASVSAGPGSEVATVSSVEAVPVLALDFTLADSGEDVVATNIERVTASLTTSTAVGTDGIWTLDGPDIDTPVEGTWRNILGQPVVEFVGLSITIDNGGSEVYGIYFVPQNQLLTSRETQTWVVTVDHASFAEAGTGASLAESDPVSNDGVDGGGLTLEVVATQLSVEVGPAASEAVDTGFTVTIGYTDSRGNRDLDVTGENIVTTRSDTNGVTPADGQAVSAGGASFSVSLAEPGDASGSLFLTFTDDIGGSLSLGSVNSDTFDLVDDDDENSTIEPGEGSEVATIDSVAGYDNPVTVLDFDVVDAGTSDGLATLVTRVELSIAGSLLASEHSWTLTGPDLGDPRQGVISDGTTIAFASLPISVPDGQTETYEVQLQLARTPEMTQDTDWMSLTLSPGGVLISASGTSLGSWSALSNSSLTYNVVATALEITSQPAAATELTIGTGFAIGAEYVDGNGNRDLSVGSSDVVTVTRSDAGTVTSGGSDSAASGIINFPSVVLGTPSNAGGDLSLTLTDNAGGTVNAGSIQTNQYSLCGANDDDSTVGPSGVLTEPATIDSVTAVVTAVDVFDFTLSDSGAGDCLPSEVSSIVLSVTGTAVPSEHIWELRGPDLLFPVAGVAAGSTVSFSGLSISVEDSSSEVYIVSLELAADPTNTGHGDTFNISLSDIGVTSSGGTTFTTSSAANSGLIYTVSISASASTTSAATCAGNNGQVTFSYSGGTPAYAFEWDDPAGQTSLTATGLGFGTYTGTVTDANEGSAQDSTNVTVSCSAACNTTSTLNDMVLDSVVQPTTLACGTSSCVREGTYVTLSVARGTEYTVTTCQHPNAGVDSILTVYTDAGDLIAHNDDDYLFGAACTDGVDSLFSTMRFTPNADDTHHIYLFKYSGSAPQGPEDCATDTFCIQVDVTCN